MALPSSEIRPIQVSNIKHEVRLCRRPGEDLRWGYETFQYVQASLILLVGKHIESAVSLWKILYTMWLNSSVLAP
jgi:hypothetical protein